MLLTAKAIAIPHKLPIAFLNMTLRYPEDCAASEQIDEEEIEKLKNSKDSWEREYGKRMEARLAELKISAKFLPDDIWDSSENCSDQGLGIFSNYDDFAAKRGAFAWENDK